MVGWVTWTQWWRKQVLGLSLLNISDDVELAHWHFFLFGINIRAWWWWLRRWEQNWKMEELLILWSLWTQELQTRVNGPVELFGDMRLPAISFCFSPYNWASSSQAHLPFHQYLSLLNCFRGTTWQENRGSRWPSSHLCSLGERLTDGKQFWEDSRWYTVKCYTEYNWSYFASNECSEWSEREEIMFPFGLGNLKMIHKPNLDCGEKLPIFHVLLLPVFLKFLYGPSNLTIVGEPEMTKLSSSSPGVGVGTKGECHCLPQSSVDFFSVFSVLWVSLWKRKIYIQVCAFILSTSEVSCLSTVTRSSLWNLWQHFKEFWIMHWLQVKGRMFNWGSLGVN